MKSKFWKEYDEVNNILKQAFIQMPGGQSQDKQAQDPAAMGGLPPGIDPAAMGAMGGMPPPGMDPAALGAMGGLPPGMDPAAMGAMGGMPPPGMDPLAMGMTPPPAGDQAAAPGSPMITISLDQLFEIIQKVLGLAKKVGANGAGVAQAPAQPEQNGLTQDQLKSTIYEALGSMVG